MTSGGGRAAEEERVGKKKAERKSNCEIIGERGGAAMIPLAEQQQVG